MPINYEIPKIRDTPKEKPIRAIDILNSDPEKYRLSARLRTIQEAEKYRRIQS